MHKIITIWVILETGANISLRISTWSKADSTLNLRVTVDQELKFQVHVNNVVQ